MADSGVGKGIAIIGLDGRFPGAPNAEELWRNLCAGVESLSRFSAEELRASGLDAARLRDPRLVPARGVLAGVEDFDAGFFGVSPREAATTDPQQRVFLECAWAALEDAGYDPATYGGLVGVYAGSALSSYAWNNLRSNPELLASLGALQLGILNGKDHLPTRVSYALNLKGPSVAVQTACSTSLVAVHLACLALLNYECDMALAGGVSIAVPQKAGYLFEEGGILSPDGHCRAFDAAARGTVMGDGAGIVVLKRLDEAVADGDRIRAVILGSAINNDGAAKVGYTAPSLDGQAEVIAAAHAVAGIDAGTITYVEAHGTGTPLGDPVEVSALTRAFRMSTDRAGYCAIGSLKTNIGHLNTAAGVAGLIKAILALEHGAIPPSLHFEQPNPRIPFAGSPFFVNARLAEWPVEGAPRRAGVSSFGIGGTNAHVVLEEAPAPEPSDAGRPWHLLVLSARTESALDTAAASLAGHLGHHPGLDLADAAYTLQVGRNRMEHRQVLVCRDAAEAVRELTAGEASRAVRRHEEARERPVAFLFPGQGAQYAGMGRELYALEPAFREQVDLCASHLTPHLGFDVRTLFDPAAAERLQETAVAQPALFVVEYALARLWAEWGVEPEVMIGHSIGEYVAACLAGVMSLPDALRLVAARGRLMGELPPGGMTAVHLPEAEVRAILPAGLEIAAVNGPALVVVAGSLAAVAAFEGELAARGIEHRRLKTSHAFHSAMMEPILEPFAQVVAAIALHEPQRDYVSNLTGRLATAAEATDPGYWVRHLRHEVRFADGVDELLREPGRVCLEIGPGRALTTLVRQHPGAQSAVAIPAMRPQTHAGSDLAWALEALGRAWLAGVHVDWQGFHRHHRRLRAGLPGYPFERQRHWIEARPDRAAGFLPAAPERIADPAGWFHARIWRRSAGHGSTAAEPGTWLLFAAPHGLGGEIRGELAARGARVVLADLARTGEAPSLLAGLRADGIAPRCCALVVESCTPGPAAAGALAALLSSLAGDAGEIPELVLVTECAEDVIGDEATSAVASDALAALAAEAARVSGLAWRCVDVGAEGARRSDRLVDELLAPGPLATLPVVALRHGRRWLPDHEAVRLERREGAIRSDGRYLVVSGGSGAVEASLAVTAALEGAGARVLSLAADPAALSAAPELAGGLHGVVVTDCGGTAARTLAALDAALGDRVLDFRLALAPFVTAARARPCWRIASWQVAAEAGDGWALTPAEAAEAFVRLLSWQGEEHLVVSPRDPSGPAPAAEPASAAVPQMPAPEGRSGHVAPRNPVERDLAAIWEHFLGVAPVGVFDSFLELGGHSLLATRVAARMREVFAVDVPLSSLFEAPHLAALAADVAARQDALRGPGAAEQGPAPRLLADPAARHESFPLTEVQQAYWIGRGAAFELGNVAAHSYLEVEVRSLDLPRLNAALHRLIDRHEMLRAVVTPDGRQRILAEVPAYQIAVDDLRGVAPEAAGATLAETRRRLAQEVVPTDRWPLFAVRASLLEGGVTRLHIRLDYLIADAWSARILARDAGALYADPGSALPPLDVSFRDYVLSLAALRETAEHRRALDYWQGRLAALPPAPDLPLAVSPTTLARPRFERRRAALPAALWAELKRRFAATDLAPSAALAAVFAEILTGWSKSPRFTINLTLFNRLPVHPQVAELVGDFTSLTLLAVDNEAADGFLARARRLQRQLWRDLDHQSVSAVQVLRELAQSRGELARGAMPVVFTSTLSMSGGPAGGDAAAPISDPVEVVYSLNQGPQVWIDHQVSERAGELVFNWDSVEGLFPPGLIDAMFGAYRALLESLARSDEAWAVAPLPLLPAAQLEQRAAVNATAAPLTGDLLHTLFREQAARRPEATAVVGGDRRLTYGELAARAGWLGRRLREMGARRNTLVAVVMEKGWEQVAAVLGVLESGAAYLPLDPALPAERLGYLLAHGEVGIALTQSWLEDRLDWPAGIARLAVDREPAPEGAELLEIVQEPGDLAYVIYTSGSTGLPKGVMIDHRGAVNTLLDVNRRFTVGAEDAVLAISSLSFDLSVYDIFGLLAAGGRVIVPEPGTSRDAGRWVELLRREGVTLWNTVPALLEMLVEHAAGRPGLLPPALRLALLSGDWIPLSLPDRARQLLQDLQVVSLGGATEASIWSILYPIGEVAAGWKSVPYGRPMVNQTFAVLDGQLEPRPVWVPGQLYIGGAGVALGYWRDEERTAASFIHHPRTGERLYRTGDLGRYLPDGTIEFLGREDFQVKIQGFRIELGEIEAALAHHPAVRDSVVAAVGAPQGDRRLVAYVVPGPAPLAAHSAEAESEQVAQWRVLFDETYGASAGEAATFDIAGWKSSYGGDIPAEEMHRWVAATVERILALRPRRVLEIGCGTGLLLFRVAPSCEVYRGTDLSAAALASIRRQIAAAGLDLPQLHLAQATADDFSGIEPGSFDLVVINSVVQYFPDVDYLLRVLTGAAAAVAPGGHVFVGDVRDLPTLPVFQAAIELAQALADLSREELRRRIEQRTAQEEELVVAPDLFRALGRHLPAVRWAAVEPKRGRDRNELVDYRYDVTLEIGPPAAPREVRWLDWEEAGGSLAALRGRWLAGADEPLAVRGLSNARIAADLAALTGTPEGAAGTAAAVDPEDLWSLAAELSCEITLEVSGEARPGALDVVLWRPAAVDSPFPLWSGPDPLSAAPDWKSWANDPLRPKLARTLVPELRTYLRRKLPEYMVPAAFVVLDRLPLTANGKVDRSALPAPGTDAAAGRGTHVAPRTATEQVVAEVWAQVLRVERVGAEDGFFDLGGHSLLAIQVLSRLRDVLQVEVPVHALFESPTVAGLAQEIDAIRQRTAPEDGGRLRPVSRDQRLPLSFSQRRLWFLDQLVPGNAFYNIPAGVRLKGRADLRALAAALNEIVRRHESLRTTFAEAEGQPYQVIAPQLDLAVPQVELRHLPDAAGEAEIVRLMAQETQRPFDLAAGPLLRAIILLRAANDFVLLLTVHHIVSDGWSMGVLYRELGALYEAFTAGRPSPLPALPIQYADFAYWQHQALLGELREVHLSFWREQLAGLPVLELPTDRPRPRFESFRGAVASTTLDRSLVQALKAFSQRSEAATLFMTLLAGFKVLLARYSRQPEIVAGSAAAARNRPELEGLIGFFLNMLVLRTDLSGDPGFGEAVRRVRQVTLDAYAHQDLPFEILVDELHPERDPSRNPLCQVLLMYQNYPVEERGLEGYSLSLMKVDSGTAKFDLVLFVDDVEQGLQAKFEYNTDLFDGTTVRRMLRQLEILLRSAVASPEQPVTELALIDDVERHQLLAEWNDTERPYAAADRIEDLFERAAARHPEAVAVVSDDGELTYRELDEQANQLAWQLTALGVGPGRHVAIYLERSAAMIPALLGVLKAGGAYVPLEVTYPEARIEWILDRLDVRWMVTQESLLPTVRSLAAGALDVVCLDPSGGAAALAAQPRHRPARPTVADGMAYVIFTSGSTGTPKGVMVRHAAVVNLIDWINREHRIGPRDRVLFVTSLCFDLSVYDVFGLLAAGGSIRVVSAADVRDPQRLLQILTTEPVTFWDSAPATLQQLAPYFPATPCHIALRRVFLSGDWIPLGLPDQVRASFPGTTVISLGGATEATVWSNSFPVGEVEPHWVSIPYGRPMQNARYHALDAELAPAPIGVPGDLYIAGDCLSTGYEDPVLTAEKYLPDPSPDRPGARLYKTGDLVRHLPDGNLEFLGRADQQVKVRGFRIELGEIESVLARHPAVVDAVVAVREDEPGDQRLVAYAVPRHGGAVSTASEEDWRLRIAEWQAIYDNIYGDPAAALDPTFNIAGWRSSYTGQALPAGEMREWVDDTVSRILALRPQRVLEIGCGTGLLLFRVAPHCRSYWATDFSRTALQAIRRTLDSPGLELPQVRLFERLADDFDGLQAGSFDLVIINSVVQYFPGIEYLARVVSGAAGLLAPGGHLLVGDVRSLPLLPTFHASVQLHQASSDLAAESLRQLTREGVAREEELVVDPAFFAGIERLVPGLDPARILLKRGACDNELNRFRYDVILAAVSGEPRVPEPCRWLAWEEEGWTFPVFAQFLDETLPSLLGIYGVPNARLAVDLELERLLAVPDGPATAGDLREALAALPERGVDPSELWRLGESLGFAVEISWSVAGKGRFDAIFRDSRRAWQPVAVPRSMAAPERLADLANDPLQARAEQRLASTLRTWLQQHLPPYMMPSDFVLLEALPLTANGKLDRRALPAPSRRSGRAMGAPRNPLEQKLVEIWAEVLGIEQVGVHDNFFELGGHSLLATQVMARATQALGEEIPLRSLFENPTVAGLAASFGRSQGAAHMAALPRIEPVPRDRPVPLSYSQLRLWLLDRLSPGNVAYSIPTALRMEGNLAPAALAASLSEIVRRHEVLRTTFVLDGDEPVQVIAPALPLPVAIVDLSGLPAERRNAVALGLKAADAARPFDLAVGPLLRVCLLRFGEREHWALASLHHIVGDGWSVGLFIRELAALYEAAITGRPSPLLPLPVQYADYAHWQRQTLRGARLAALVDYWRQHLTGAPAVLDLPLDRPRPAVQTYAGDLLSVLVPGEVVERLRAIGRAEASTLFMSLLAAFGALLRRSTRAEDLVIGTSIAGRTQVEIEGLIGFFVNTLALRLDTSGDPELSTLLRQTRETALGAFANQDLPFEKLVDELQPERSLSHSPLFQVIVVLQNAAWSSLELPGVSLGQVTSGAPTAKYDLTLLAEERDDQLAVMAEYNTDLFDRATMARLLSHLARLLESAAAEPHRRLSELGLMSTPEEHQLLREWNDSQVARPDVPPCLHELFAAQARRTPGAVAVRAGDATLSYGELERRANQLARHLRARGIGVESRVGVCVERSLEMMVALLGILKAGAAYVPLDPAHPVPRLAQMLEDAGVQVGVTLGRLKAGLPPGTAEWILLDTDGPSIERWSGEPVAGGAGAENLAYVIYTSGSTGRPKGVMIPHAAIANRLLWMQERFPLSPSDRVLQKTPYTFDASIWELFVPLFAGAEVVMARPGGQQEPAYMVEAMARHDVTVLQLVPSMLPLILAEKGLDECRCLRRLFCGGEALPIEACARFVERTGARVVNLYGPTETAIDASSWPYEPGAGHVIAPIGRPLSNLGVRILVEAMQPAPLGSPGELHVGGISLARGYLGRPDLTAERFVPDPFAGSPGERLYRTGDLAKWAADGNLHYLGRSDHQVKVRGFRIELSEIEEALKQEPGVREAVVLARDGASGKRLVAYLVAAAGEVLDEERLRAALGGKLPEWMVPATFVTLTSMPLNTSGKLDRSALPEPEAPRLAGAALPRTAAERKMAEIWAQVLGLDAVGIHDNFFSLGGDSILSILIASRANQAGFNLSPRLLFKHQTVAELAAAAQTGDGVRAEQDLVTGEAPLTPIQRYLLDADIADPHHYNQALLLEVRERLDLEALAAAVATLVRHHDALRLRFAQGAAGWTQSYGEGANGTFAAVDLSGLPAETRGAAMLAASTALQAGIDLGRGPLVRVVHFALGALPDRLLIVVHHLVVDGVSWRILLQDLEESYRQLARGAELPLPAKTSSFKEWAIQLAEHAQSAAVLGELDYWLDRRRAGVTHLPVDRPQGHNLSGAARIVSVSLDRETTRDLLQQVPGTYRIQSHELLLAAVASTLAQWTGSPLLLIDLEGHGREEVAGALDVSRTVGWFTAVFPVVLELAVGQDAEAALKAVKEQLRRIPRHGIGYGLLRYLTRAPEALPLRAQPQAEVSFNYLGQVDQTLAGSSPFALAAEPAGPARSPRQTRRYLLEVDAVVLGGCLQVNWTYSEAVHRRETIEALAERCRERLAGFIRHALSGAGSGCTPSDFPLARLDQAAVDRLADRDLEDVLPLSPLQLGFLFHALHAPEAGTYIQQLVSTLEGGLDVDAFERAWQEVVRRHTILRTAFVWEGLREPLQVVRRDVTLRVERLDWTGLAHHEVEVQSAAFIAEDRQRGFDLSAAPLMRLALIELPGRAFRLVWSHHHLLLDGWSVPSLLVEVFRIYAALRDNRRPELPPAQPYRAYIEWLQGQDLESAETFWRTTFAGCEVPTPLPGSGRPDDVGQIMERIAQLSAEESQAILTMARRSRLTLGTLVLGAWALMLRRLSGRNDVVFGLTLSVRPADLAGVESMVGVLLNTLPVRIRCAAQERAVSWLRALQAQQVEIRQHEHSPLVDVQQWAEVPRGVPFFESVVTIQNYPIDQSLREHATDLAVRDVRFLEKATFPLSLALMPGSRLPLQIRYDGERFAASQIERWLGYLQRLLVAFSGLEDESLGDLDTLLEEMDRQERAAQEKAYREIEAEKFKKIRRRSAPVSG
ncbi:MAG: amino acid adenylation domain-containing protein [Acidobacteria bacterium]|nr:amino acid adenylation domain-containing protein [Acidobacteriota bacterium]